MPEPAKINQLIERRHPEYRRMSSKWDFFLDSYMAPIDEFATNYLFQNEKEGDDEFRQRCDRAYRENHSKRVVDLINTYLFKESAVRKTEDTHIKQFFKDVDGKGHNMTQFMKAVSLYSSILGRVYIVVDRRDPEQATGTYKDDLEAKPYCYILQPQDVLDISFDAHGRVLWALVREKYREDEDPFTGTGEMKNRFRLWQGGKWWLWDEGGKEIESGDTKLKDCPIIPVNNEESVSNYYAPSLIADVSYLDRSIFNNYSRLDVIVNDQTFSQLIFPIEGALTTSVVDDQELQGEMMQRAVNRILFYAAGAESKPEYISPDASQAEFVLSMIQHQTKQVYACVGLQNEGSGETKDYKSGVSKSYDFDKLNKLLASKASNLEQAEERLIEMVKQWKDTTGDVEIEYPDEFDVRSLQQEIMFAQELSLLDISDKFIKRIYKRVVDKALPKLPEKELKEIHDEIDERNFHEEGLEQNAGLDFNKPDPDDNFQEKKKKKDVGGRASQDQTKFDQT